jgi:hypothetical protein
MATEALGLKKVQRDGLRTSSALEKGRGKAEYRSRREIQFHMKF